MRGVSRESLAAARDRLEALLGTAGTDPSAVGKDLLAVTGLLAGNAGLRRAEAAQAEAAQVLEQYRQQLAEARQEAGQLRERAKQDGAEIIAEMREQAQAEASRITAAAGAQIEAERRAAMVQLRGEVARWATELASRIVGESLEDEARQSRVVERFLAEIEAAPAGAGREA